jgi:hypothetical protein
MKYNVYRETKGRKQHKARAEEWRTVVNSDCTKHGVIRCSLRSEYFRLLKLLSLSSLALIMFSTDR